MRKSQVDIDECGSRRLAAPLSHVMKKAFVHDFSIDVSVGILADVRVILSQIVPGNAPGVLLLSHDQQNIHIGVRTPPSFHQRATHEQGQIAWIILKKLFQTINHLPVMSLQIHRMDPFLCMNLEKTAAWTEQEELFTASLFQCNTRGNVVTLTNEGAREVAKVLLPTAVARKREKKGVLEAAEPRQKKDLLSATIYYLITKCVPDSCWEFGSILVKALLPEVKSSVVCARRTICFPQISSYFTKSEPEPSAI